MKAGFSQSSGSGQVMEMMREEEQVLPTRTNVDAN